MPNLRTCMLLLAIALAGPAFAQIFPELEREDVLKRAPAGADNPKPVKPVEGGAKVDGEAVLKRYNDLLSGYLNERSIQKKAYAPFVGKVHDSVRDYIEGMALLRLGYYDEAAKSFKSAGYTVKKDGDIKGPPPLRAIIDEIKVGKAYYYQMIAVVMQDYREFKSDTEFETVWDRARKRGQALADECKSLADRKRIDTAAGTNMANSMEGTLALLKNMWRTHRSADERVQSKPADVESWLALIYATGMRDMVGNEAEVPCCLKRRAAARVIKEFWPQSAPAIDGGADIALAKSHFSALQFDDYGQYLTAQPGHSDIGKAALDEFLSKARTAHEELLKLRGE